MGTLGEVSGLDRGSVGLSSASWAGMSAGSHGCRWLARVCTQVRDAGAWPCPTQKHSLPGPNCWCVCQVGLGAGGAVDLLGVGAVGV